MDGSLTQRLVGLIDTADADPLTSIDVVQQMEVRDELGDPIDRARAHHAAGIAHRSIGDLGLALIDLSSGIDVAKAAGRPDIAALVQLTRSAVHLMTGDVDSCRRDLNAAMSNLAPEHEVDGLVQLASVEHRLGNLDDAAANYRSALSLAELQDRPREEARLHSNLGLLLTETGSYDEAGDHLERAVDMFSSLGLRDGAIFSEHNLGYLRMLEGDLVVALRHFDDANTAAVDIGAAPAANIDKSAALLMAGLPGEALAAAMDAAAALAHGDITELSDALTSAARAALRANRPDEAQRLADRALQTAASLGRRGWEASVRAVRLRAAVASQQVAAVDALHEWAVLHDDLVELGVWPLVHDVAVTAAECAAELGSPTEARLWLGRLAHRTPMSPPERAELHHAAALCLRAVGDTTGATEAAGAAVDAARHATSWLGTLDLRLGSSTRQARSARLAAELAFERDDPSRALMWIDISLSAGLDLPPLLPPADPALRGARAELRAARDALAMELSDGDDAEAVRRCVVRVERAEAAAADQLHLTLPNAAEANPNEELPGLPQATTSALWLVV
ncbi:MAG: tetratricopeptide repeat protein, partial [Actinomycetia bacterium]|nr:tetratricopeptide repeat protein [Actinomycetes bacterium]